MKFNAIDKIKSFASKSIQFLKEARVELRKVTWPTRKQALASTSVVLIVVIIVSIFLGIVDFGLAKVVGIFLG